MLLTVNSSYSYEFIKDGVAFFDKLTGHTHFLSAPLCSIFEILSKSPCTKQKLFEQYCTNNNLDETNESNPFNEFVTEAINSGIILK